MIQLPDALKAWGTPAFRAALKQELERQEPCALPLQEGLSTSSHALDDPFSVVLVAASEEPGRIHARVGIFYHGLIAGCSCADDPTPVEPQDEYCELLLDIDRTTAATRVTLAPD
ncbi:MAG: hypothetical protein PHR30_10190 [Gallionellaceae bacterium]|nr:hypothetical protein [Gallionellaceae bacterium]